MALITFEGETIEIFDNLLDEEQFDIDFNGQMIVKFERQKDNSFIATNGMNGYGANIADEIRGKLLIIS